ncbi:Uncharacterised protein [Ralstonia mannitolilytica]|nr:Uncharacterised protein [Ralstonia mannitolilytica]
MQMREWFEQEAKRCGMDLSNTNGIYSASETHRGWHMWQRLGLHLEETVKDAERYRWLLANWHDGKGCWCDSLYAPKDLTKAIDAAIAATQGGEDEEA